MLKTYPSNPFSINLSFVSFIFSFVFFSFIDHTFDFFFGQSTLVVGDGDVVLLTSALIFSRDIEDTISINIKGNFNLWDTTRSWRDSRQFEFTQQVVIFGHTTFSFINLDQDTRLVIRISRENLGFLGWDGSVSRNQSSHNSSSSFQTKSQWSNIKKKKIIEFFIRFSF